MSFVGVEDLQLTISTIANWTLEPPTYVPKARVMHTLDTAAVAIYAVGAISRSAHPYSTALSTRISMTF